MINNVPVKRVPFHKYLGLVLDSKLDFNESIHTMLFKVNKMITLLRTFRYIVPWLSLLTIWKTYSFFAKYAKTKLHPIFIT